MPKSVQFDFSSIAMPDVSSSPSLDEHSLPGATKGVENSSKKYSINEASDTLLPRKKAASLDNVKQNTNGSSSSSVVPAGICGFVSGVVIGALSVKLFDKLTGEVRNSVATAAATPLANIPAAAALKFTETLNDQGAANSDLLPNDGNQLAYRGWAPSHELSQSQSTAAVGTAFARPRTDALERLRNQGGSAKPSGGMDALRQRLASDPDNQVHSAATAQPNKILHSQDTWLIKNSLNNKIMRHYSLSSTRRECLNELNRLFSDVINSENSDVRSKKFSIFKNLHDQIAEQINSKANIEKIKLLIDASTNEMQLASSSDAYTTETHATK
ncbi:hypothetical protein KDW36_29415 [Burkholderia dolosa]|uniref:hypothetical protein n=1 Tax=Burkholderia dolosa TaxID=152500 RepID=UPI001B978330|nr:hypothetical protein [Burkholderia dolosa]MBR8317285.1 hypothetical protein [Burkholderia dolosa]